MWSFIVPIIVKLLIEFLIALFKKWAGGERALALSYSPSLREEFIQKLKYRFWLGPQRYDIARRAFDLAAQKHDFTVKPVGLNPDSLARWTCSDIAKNITL